VEAVRAATARASVQALIAQALAMQALAAQPSPEPKAKPVTGPPRPGHNAPPAARRARTVRSGGGQVVSTLLTRMSAGRTGLRGLR
jgi:hypothetical protein